MSKKNKAFDHSKYQTWIDPNQVVPYERNAKIHDKKQIKNIVNSIKRFGWQQDTAITKDMVCVIGHWRRLAAIEIGCEMPYHMIDKDADELTDEDIRELRHADNLTNAQTGFATDLMDEDYAELDFDGFDFDEFFNTNVDDEDDDKYTLATNIPQYEPTGELPTFAEMYDLEKTNSLIDEINAQDGISDDERAFLIEAAKRHTVFNYRNIAEYYAQATPEMQSLMEKSALVIIDVDDAIANGYAKLQEDILELMEDADAE